MNAWKQANLDLQNLQIKYKKSQASNAELLEALQTVMPFLEQFEDTITEMCSASIANEDLPVTVARAAIAKAEEK